MQTDGARSAICIQAKTEHSDVLACPEVIWEEAASHSPYTLHYNTHFLLKISHLLHGSLGPSDPPPQATSWSNWPFFQISRSLPTERPTDRPTEWTGNSAYTNNRFAITNAATRLKYTSVLQCQHINFIITRPHLLYMLHRMMLPLDVQSGPKTGQLLSAMTLTCMNGSW